MSDCIFCKIINGEIPCDKVYEDDQMIAIKDVAPVAPVHVLLIPKKHVPNILATEADLRLHLSSKMKELVKKLGVEEKGFRLVINTGVDGGQTVEHLHIHLIGGKILGWPPC